MLKVKIERKKTKEITIEEQVQIPSARPNTTVLFDSLFDWLIIINQDKFLPALHL